MQKPKKVLEAINKNYSFNYSNVHRGLHKLSEEATSSYEGARKKVANFLKCDERNLRNSIFIYCKIASISCN